MRKRLPFLIFLFFATTMSVKASESDSDAFVIGVQDFSNYAPYSQYQNADYQGFNRELLDAFAKAQGLSFEYRALPIKRLYDDFLRGSVDLKYPDNPNWSAALKENHDILYSEPVVSFVDGVVTLKENHSSPPDTIRRLGLIAGYTPWPFLEQIKRNRIKTTEVKDMDALIRLLMAKRIDGIYTNVSVFSTTLKKSFERAPEMALNQNLPYLSSTRHLSSWRYPDIVVQFNRFLQTHAALVESLKTKHGLLEAEDILTPPKK